MDETKLLLDLYPNVIAVAGLNQSVNVKSVFLKIKSYIKEHLYNRGWVEPKGDLLIIYLNLEDIISIKKALEHLQKKINNEYLLTMSCGIGSKFYQIKDMAESYNEAMKAYKNLLFFPEKTILTFREYKLLSFPPGSYAYEMEALILNALRNLDFTSCKHKLHKFINYALKNCGNDILVLKRWYEYFYFSLNRFCDEKGCNFSYQTMSEWKRESDFYGDMVNMLDVVIDAVRAKSNITDPITMKIISILNTRFNEEISLDILSEEVGLSPVYLSRLFKEQTGQTYKSYITTVRMEKAKMLLKDLQKPISQVSTAVGYSDANYFSEAFKRYQGISPTEYRHFKKASD